MSPSVRSTWAPRGRTPVLNHVFGYQRLSIAGCLAYSPDRSQARFFFEIITGTYKADSLITFLGRLSGEFPGESISLIWDNLPAHRARLMTDFITAQDWLSVTRLPGYAPDLNPVEGIWSALKGHDLANYCPRSREALHAQTTAGLKRLQAEQTILFGCLTQTGLTLE
jgi:transposase